MSSSSSPLKRPREGDASSANDAPTTSPKVEPLTPEEVKLLLLQYMKVDDYAVKTVTLPGAVASATPPLPDAGAGDAEKRLESPKEKTFDDLKTDFLEQFEDTGMELPENLTFFKSFKNVRDKWAGAIPDEVKECKGPITEDVLLKSSKMTVENVCTNFFSSMLFEKLPATTENLLKAALFLLEGSLAPRHRTYEILQAKYDELTEIDQATLDAQHGPRVLYSEEARPLFHGDLNDRSPERTQVERFFDPATKGRKSDHVLMIGGESGSGKTHLGLHAAKIGLAHIDSKKTLTVLAKVTEKMSGLADLEKEALKLSNENKKEERNMKVADFLCHHMCKLCGFSEEVCNELVAPFVPWKHQKFFEATVLVVDETITSPAIMRSLSTSVKEGFMQLMKARNMSRFFGNIHIVCCSTGSKDSIRNAGSSPNKYTAIQMQPSKNLFEILVGNAYLSGMVKKNVFMAMVENRRCAVYAAEGVERLTSLHSVEAQKTKEVQGDAGEPLEKDILSACPTFSVARAIAGFVAIYTASRYANTNGLVGLSPTERFNLAVSVVQEFLRAPSLANTILPFEGMGEKFDPIRKGIVDSHTSPISTPSTDKQVIPANYEERNTFTFSHAQMVLACCSYGAAAIPMDTPDSFEALSAAVFALYLSAYADGGFGSLFGFLKLMDRKWPDCGTTVVAQDEQQQEGGITVAQDEELGGAAPQESKSSASQTLLFFDTEYTTAKLPFSKENDGEEKLTDRLLKNLKESRDKYRVSAVLSPPFSNYADSLIVFGKTLFLIQSKKRVKFGTHSEVRKEVLKMGLMLETMAADEKTTFSKHQEFTGKICKELGISRVVPVFCVSEVADNSKIPEMKTWMPGTRTDPDAYVYPMTFVPQTELKVTFTRQVKNDKPQPWAYSKQIQT